VTAVLVVEDERIVSRDVQQRLADLGYSVAGAAVTGEEAICKAEELRPDLVLMDIVLGGPMDGVAAARTVKQLFDIPVVFLTAHSDEKTVERAKTAGAFGCLVKPFVDRDLKLAIELTVEKSRAECELRQSEARYRMMTTVSPAGIFLADASGGYQYVNARWSHFSGLGPDEARGDGWLRSVHPEDRERVAAAWQRNIRSGGGWCPEYRFVTAGGKTTWVVGDAAPMKSASGDVMGFIGTNLDITEHKRAETERQALLVRRSQGDLHRLMISALPSVGSVMSEEARNMMMCRFGELLEKNSKAAFLVELGTCTGGEGESVVVFQCFLSAFSAWMANLGIRTTTVDGEGGTGLVFLNCPFAEAARENVVFCLMCRVMASRAFEWTGLPGEVRQRSSRADSGDSCRFDITVRDRPGKPA
jgi:PAS domain S-box-containing protein